MADEAQVTFGGVTITSTTEDQVALDTVLAVPESPDPDVTPAVAPAVPTPPKTETPAVPTPPVTETPAVPTPPKTETPAVPTPPKKETSEEYGGRARDRINGMTATMREQDRRIAELEGQLATQQAAVPSPEPAAMPSSTDFIDNADGYIQALAASEATNATHAALAADREQRQVAQQATKAEQVQSRWNQGIQEMRARHTDYDALTQQAGTTETLGQSALNQVLGHLVETPQGPEVLHSLLSEPGALTRVGAMSHLDQVRDFAVRASRVGGIPAVIPAPSTPAVPGVLPVTPPIPPVNPGAAHVPKSPDEMTPSEYDKWANQNNIRTG